MRGEKGWIDWITGIKGWCCITVVILHLLACFYPEVLTAATYIFDGNTYNYISLTPLNILFNGSFSVYIFWMTGSFLIAYSWYERHSPADMERKLLNKYFRPLFPIVAVSALAFILIKTNLYYNVQAGEIIGNSFFTNERDWSLVTVRTLIEDVLWRDFFVGRVTLIPPLWTMPAELLGSCMTVLLLVLFGDNEYRYVLWGILSVILLKYSALYLCFIMGIVLADYFRNMKKPWTGLGILSFCMGIVLGSYPPSGIPQSGIYGWIYQNVIVRYNGLLLVDTGVHLMYVLAAALILFGCISCLWVRKGMENPVFVWLGERSFYIYILHLPIIMSVTAWTFVKVYESCLKYRVSVIVSGAVIFIVCLVFSEILRYISEKWLMPLSKLIVDLMTRKDAVAVQDCGKE